MIYVKFQTPIYTYLTLTKPHVLLGAPAARATLDALGPPLVHVMPRQFPPKLFEVGVPLPDKLRIRALELVAEVRPIGMRKQSHFEAMQHDVACLIGNHSELTLLLAKLGVAIQKDIVQRAARNPQVVHHRCILYEYGYLQSAETFFQHAKDTLDVFASLFQPDGPHRQTRLRRVL